MKVLTIDIGGTTTKYGLFTDGQLESRQERPTDAGKGADHVIELICEIAAQFKGMDCLGVSTCGYVDPREKKIAFATEAVPGYTGVQLGRILEERTGLPVAVENDAKCAAIGELHYGMGKEHKDFIYLTYGTGIGGAIVIDGVIYHGCHGIAGGLGHMITHSEGLECTCGNRGCYEMYASTRALLSRVKEAIGITLDGRQVFARVEDKRIQREIDLWIDEVVKGLISLMNILDPSIFILGGGIMEQKTVIQEIGKRLIGNTIGGFTDISVCSASLGNAAGLYGAYTNALSLLDGDEKGEVRNAQ